MSVTRELREAVFRRDRACVLAKLLPQTHECRDVWGMPHAPTDLAKCSLEHVKSELRMGKRAPDDMEHLVVLCYGSNVGVPSKYERGLLRKYLQDVGNPHDSHVDPCGPDCRVAV